MKRDSKKSSGFTLLEVILAVAIITVITAISIPVQQNLVTQNSLSTAKDELVSGIYRAKTLSEAGEKDSNWGIKIQPDSVTIFKGISYTSRDANFDEILDSHRNITFSGLDEIVFSKYNGEPSTQGSIVITGENGDTKNITINEKGTLEY